MRKKTKNNKKNIDKFDLFSKFIENLTLLSIELLEVKLLKSDNFMPPAETKISQESKIKKTKNEEGNIIVYNKYILKAKSKMNEKNTLTLVARYKTTYFNSQEISDDLYDEFETYNITMVIWPYFRHFVQEMTMKANLPPLMIDLLSFPIHEVEKPKSK